MENVYIKKVANGYVVEIGYSDDELLFIYKTKEEMLSALPELVEQAHKEHEEIEEANEDKKAKAAQATKE